MNNCHYWDNIFREKCSDQVSKLPPVNENAMIAELLANLDSHYCIPIRRMIEQDPFDHCLGYRPRLLLAQTWSIIRESNDRLEIFKSQLEDMIETSGYCSQGWNNRLIQILFACEIISLE